MKKKIATLSNQLKLNKIKFKKASAELTLEDILDSFKGKISFPMVTKFSKFFCLYCTYYKCMV